MSLRLSLLSSAVVSAIVLLITASPAAAADVDLQVTQVEPLSTPVCAGSTPTIRAYIKNNGAAESGFFGIRWEVDGVTFDGGHFSIPSGATDTHDHIWSSGPGAGPTPIAAGTHTVRFIADVDNAVGEADEANNDGVLTFQAVSCQDPAADKYVALGDSFSSGDGALDYIASSGACRQSNNAYPKVLAAGLIPRVRVPSSLIFYACSGNRIADVRNNQLPLFGVIDASSVKLVTITVGGNDVDFVKVLSTCYGGLTPQAATAACLRQTPAVAGVIANQATSLVALFRSIRSAAPDARVLVLGYPDLFPQRPTKACSGFSTPSQAWFNSQEELLNSTIRTAASRAGVEFVSTYGAFSGHEVCSSDPYVNGFPAPTFDQLAFHPKPVGQAKLAAVVGDYLRTRPIAS
ncbi:MAG: GDSL-type esterase/lipase family protein [Pseudonocardia sp.]